MPKLSMGQWRDSIPGEIQLMLQDQSPEWDWQVRAINGNNWFVARIGSKTVAGKIEVESETPAFVAVSDG